MPAVDVEDPMGARNPSSAGPLVLSSGAVRPWDAAVDRLGWLAAGFFAVVVVAAGASGAALVLAPGSTDRYFSWTLRPAGAAALIGGLYLASATVFGWALTLPWRQVRPLVVGVFGLAVPTLALTLVHDEVFDFGRWQAAGWLGLFLAAPVSATAIVLGGDREPGGGPPLLTWSRAALGALALALLALAVAIWFDDTRGAVARQSPVGLVRLTGTYLGAWCSFMALLCGWAAVRSRWDDARVPLATVVAASAGATVGLLRSWEEVRRPFLAVVTATGLLVAAAAMYAANRPSRRRAVG